MWPLFMILNLIDIMTIDLQGQGGHNGGHKYKDQSQFGMWAMLVILSLPKP